MAKMAPRSCARSREEPRKKGPPLVRVFWGTAREFWSHPKSWKVAWLMTAVLIVLVVGQLVFSYQLNLWNKTIFDALEKKDSATVLRQALIFIPLAAGSIAVAVAVVYARMRMQRRWRAWLTEHTMTRWLAKGRYYQLNVIEGDHKNPEARIAEDTRIATEQPVDFAVGILSAVLTSATFMGVLWTVGGGLTVPGTTFYIPGYLVFAVVIYCVIISGLMMVIARSFVPTAEMKNQTEAEFRAALTRVREYGESIAILGGEKEERSGLDKLLSKVITTWSKMAQQYMRTMFVSHGNFIIASVIPIILCAPKYLAGEMTPRHRDAGGRRLHPGAIRVQLDRRQLSAAGRMGRLGAPRLQPAGGARRPRPAGEARKSARSSAAKAKAPRSGCATCRSRCPTAPSWWTMPT